MNESIEFYNYNYFLWFLDPRVKELWCMGSIWPITIVIVIYLYFVLKIGPEFMKYRNPMKIDRIVAAYNAVQVLFSLYLVEEVSKHIIGIIVK